MTTYGYARVSSTGQSLDIQLADLQSHGCDIVRQEKVSGRTTENRPELATLLDFIREGDTLVVTRLDRLARSTLDLCRIVKALETKGAKLKCTQQPIETSTPTGRMMVQLLGVFAEFENEIRRERQMAGIAAAKETGVYKGKSAKYDYAHIRREAMARPGLSSYQLARALDCSRQTIYRALATS